MFNASIAAENPPDAAHRLPKIPKERNVPLFGVTTSARTLRTRLMLSVGKCEWLLFKLIGPPRESQLGVAVFALYFESRDAGCLPENAWHYCCKIRPIRLCLYHKVILFTVTLAIGS